jgi:hypothetical protein
MARAHFWQHILNIEGQPIPNVLVRIKEDISGSYISFYTTSSGGVPSASILTDSKGFFEVWVPDKEITLENGCATNSTFTINLSASSFEAYDYMSGIQLLFQPPRMYTLDVSGANIVESPSNVYTVLAEHNLNTDFPIVQAWLNDGTLRSVEVSCTSVDSNSLSASVSSTETVTLIHFNIIGKDL